MLEIFLIDLLSSIFYPNYVTSSGSKLLTDAGLFGAANQDIYLPEYSIKRVVPGALSEYLFFHEEMLSSFIDMQNISDSKAFIDTYKDIVLKKHANIIKANAASLAGNTNLLEDIKNIGNDLEKKIDNHVEKYRWIPYDYGVGLWNKEHFLEEIKKLVSRKTSQQINSRLDELIEYGQNIRAKKEKIGKQFKIDRKIMEMFEAVAELAYLNDLKKEVFTRSHVMIRPILDEMAKRANLTWDLLSFLMPAVSSFICAACRSFGVHCVNIYSAAKTKNILFTPRSEKSLHRLLNIWHALPYLSNYCMCIHINAINRIFLKFPAVSIVNYS